MTTAVEEPQEQDRRCLVKGCTWAPRNADGFLCAMHWFQLPRALRTAIWRAYHRRDRRESLRLVRQALAYFEEA
jgi:hypothetical protein